MSRPVQVGVINLMPRVEGYEPLIERALAPHGARPVWIRMETHGYRSSDPARLRERYRTWGEALAEGPLDAVLLTGAPVEELPLPQVRYWPELSAVLRDARRRGACALGLCWGAMALAALEGVEKETLPAKVFGSFEHELSPPGRRLLPGLRGPYRCAQSRHAGLVASSVERAEREGRVVSLARSDEAGHTLLTTADRRVWMHLGHPEYEPDRIAFEWARDREAGRPGVARPRGFDAEGLRVEAPWEADSRVFFGAWVGAVEALRSEVRRCAV